MLKRNFLKKNLIFFKISKKTILDFDPSKDYYKVLGVSKNATDKEIKTAYHKLAKKHHPDLNAGKTSDLFKEMTAAYEVLSSEDKRKQYDSYRHMDYGSGGSGPGQGAGYGGFGSHQAGSGQSGSDYKNYYYDPNSFRGFNRGQQGGAQGQGQGYTKYTYTYRDPKTGQYKTTTGSPQDNPFFKDFEDFFKRMNEQQHQNPFRSNPFNQDPYQNMSSQNNFGKDYWEKNREYFKGFREGNQNYGPNPSNKANNEDFFNFNNNENYFQYMMYRRIIRIFFISTTIFFIFLMISSRRRAERVYYMNDHNRGIDPYSSYDDYYPPQTISFANRGGPGPSTGRIPGPDAVPLYHNQNPYSNNQANVPNYASSPFSPFQKHEFDPYTSNDVPIKYK